MMVILLWGVLGVSLLLCLFVGIILCLLSVMYVFTLKNNKPEHYDTDFFESALVEAGVLQFCFGPRCRRPVNPFTDAGTAAAPVSVDEKRRSSRHVPSNGRSRAGASRLATAEPLGGEPETKPKSQGKEAEPMVTRVAFERLHEQLTTAEEMLEDALAERGED
jgi:hypothetical protein